MAEYMWRDPLLSRDLPETTDKDWYDKAKAALGGIRCIEISYDENFEVDAIAQGTTWKSKEDQRWATSSWSECLAKCRL